ncbi:MAG: flagellin N-terminal helical domain-containing protein [Planctomycetota bacterium]|jgi:flagellin-like hook-associated protein FlgL
MFDIENVLGSDFSSYSARVSYTPVTELPPAPDDAPAAIIRELLRGNVAEIRRTAIEANIAISTFQELSAAVRAVQDKLGAMDELARQAADGYCTSSEKADMQARFEELARQVNSIVSSAEYEGKKVFAAEGNAISIPLGNGGSVHIFPKDLNFDARGVDLSGDAEGAVSAVRATKAKAAEAGHSMARAYDRLVEVMACLDRDYGTAMGLDPSDFDLNLARDMTSHTTYRAMRDPSVLLQVQANVLPARAGWLLDYKGTSPALNNG